MLVDEEPVKWADRSAQDGSGQVLRGHMREPEESQPRYASLIVKFPFEGVAVEEGRRVARWCFFFGVEQNVANKIMKKK